jgi:Cysteine-rich CWC
MSSGNPNAQPGGREPVIKLCAACGEKFPCSARGGGCWCEEMTLGRDALRDLRERYCDCLCPRCLSVAAAQPAKKAQ